MIHTILWDIDGTLLDFAAAEREGMTRCCREVGIEMDEEMLRVYSAINRSWWEKLERGEVTREQVYTGRLIELFDRYHLPPIHFDAFNQRYQHALGEAVFLMDDCLQVLQALQPRVRQYAVTNGSRCAQEAKLKNSGIDRFLDGIFISELVGFQKPQVEFFDAVRRQTGYQPEETMIVGDSLTSDMAGGNNAGLVCCWYNPKGLPRKDGIRIDREIRNLWELV